MRLKVEMFALLSPKDVQKSNVANSFGFIEQLIPSTNPIARGVVET